MKLLFVEKKKPTWNLFPKLFGTSLRRAKYVYSDHGEPVNYSQEPSYLCELFTGRKKIFLRETQLHKHRNLLAGTDSSSSTLGVQQLSQITSISIVGVWAIPAGQRAAAWSDQECRWPAWNLLEQAASSGPAPAQVSADGHLPSV